MGIMNFPSGLILRNGETLTINSESDGKSSDICERPSGNKYDLGGIVITGIWLDEKQIYPTTDDVNPELTRKRVRDW